MLTGVLMKSLCPWLGAGLQENCLAAERFCCFKGDPDANDFATPKQLFHKLRIHRKRALSFDIVHKYVNVIFLRREGDKNIASDAKRRKVMMRLL